MAAGGTTTNKRQAHVEETRRAIQSAASELFAANGYAATTTRQIAARANVLPRTLFRYFPSKEDLLFEEARQVIPALGLAIRERPDSETPLDAVIAAMRTLERNQTHPLSMLATGAPARQGVASSRSRALLMEFEDALADVLLQKYESATFTSLHASVTARAAMAAARSALIAYVTPAGDGASRDPLAMEAAFDILKQLGGSAR